MRTNETRTREQTGVFFISKNDKIIILDPVFSTSLSLDMDIYLYLLCLASSRSAAIRES